MRRAWSWLTSNVIDLRKGAAVNTTVLASLLAVFAFHEGTPATVGTWAAVLGSLLLLPVAWFTLRRYLEAEGEDERSLPDWDQAESPDPPSHVRRVE